MVLTTHSIIGASFAGLLATDPALAFTVGLASHYLFDTIPHWDYELISVNRENGKLNFKDSNSGRLFDASRIALDFFVGLIASYYIFVSLAGFSWTVIIAGVLGAIIPDFLQFLHAKINSWPLTWFQRLHDFFHADKRPYRQAQLKGILWQLGIIAVIIGLTFTSLAWLK